MKFLFDLDGTVTSKETLPIIAEHFGVQDQIAELTHHTVQGNVPFVESFIRRVNILGRFSVSEISDLLARVPLYPLVSKFIKENQSDCIIVTGNLDCWCEGLYKKIGCQCYGSEAEVENDHIVKLENILRKEQIVDQYRALGETVVFIGDGNNDLEAMRHANFSIAAGLTHNPAQSLYAICDYIIFNEKALCRQLPTSRPRFSTTRTVTLCRGRAAKAFSICSFLPGSLVEMNTSVSGGNLAAKAILWSSISIK